MELRAALYESCEIIRLVNADPALRSAAVQVRELLMMQTKGKNNRLPHEGGNTKDPTTEKSTLSPLLPNARPAA